MKQHARFSGANRQNTPRGDYKGLELFQDAGEYFYFNEYIWRNTYSIFRDKQAFRENRDALISHGFICIASAHENGNRIIYGFSDGWKKWNDSS